MRFYNSVVRKRKEGTKKENMTSTQLPTPNHLISCRKSQEISGNLSPTQPHPVGPCASKNQPKLDTSRFANWIVRHPCRSNREPPPLK